MPTLTDLLEVGAHFGHKKEKSSPRARQYTYTIRDSIYVINLEKTIEQLGLAIDYLKKAIDSGKTVLFVGTKQQAKKYVKKLAESVNMPYMVERWPGGTLTNFETIRKSLKTLIALEEQIASEEFENFTKKERMRIQEKAAKLNSVFAGIKEMRVLPDMLFIVDTAKEDVAVSEANIAKIPIIGICDTNANPDLLTIPIPANDDSEKTIELLLEKIEEELLKEIKAGSAKQEKELEEKKETE